MIDNGRKLDYFPGFMKFWKLMIVMAAACFCGGLEEATAQEMPEPEMLQIRYTQSGTSYTNQVEKDVEVLIFKDGMTELHLPEGLTKLHTLAVVCRKGAYEMPKLRLPKDISKDADWMFKLRTTDMSFNQRNFTLQIHKDMGRFLVNEIRIPAAKDLIRKREPDDDGVFRIAFPAAYLYDYDEPGYSGWVHKGKFFTIEVHGIAPRISLTRQEDGVEIVWDRGQLQSAPSIDGPWTDITFDDTRRLFLRSSSPAEFFRVKP